MASFHVAPGRVPRTVSLAGELDAASAGEIAERVAAHLPGAGDARLDLSRLDLLDSRALRVLDQIARCLDPMSRLFLISPSLSVRKALEASGMLRTGKVLIAGDRTIDLTAAAFPTEPPELPFIWLG